MHTLKLLVLTFLIGCASSKAQTPAPTAAPKLTGLQINLATIYVDDLDKALRFYTETLGFAKKDDVANGDYRWITVQSANGMQLHLAKNDNPAAKAYQAAMLAQAEPAAMFFTDDVKREHARIAAKGVTFTMPPTEVMPGSTIATFDDTCGNLIQITQLDDSAR
jgi:predicted enzyme related to lactoylglutathione lyase